MLSTEHAEYIRGLEPSVFDGAKSWKFDMIVANNIREELKKNGERDEATIHAHTAQGIGFENWLIISTDFFVSETPIVKDPRKEIAFKDLMRDFRYGDEYVQVKTIRQLYGNSVYVSKAMVDSINDSYRLNSFYLFGFARQIQDTNFCYAPAFAIESEVLKRSICTNDTSHYINLDRMSKYPKYFQPLCKELLDV